MKGRAKRIESFLKNSSAGAKQDRIVKNFHIDIQLESLYFLYFLLKATRYFNYHTPIYHFYEFTC